MLFIFCCLRRTIRIKSQAFQPDGHFPQIDRWLSFNRRFFVGSLFFFFGNWFLLISRHLIKNRLPFRRQLLTRLLNGSSEATDSSTLFWASCPVSVSMDGSLFPNSRSFASFNCCLFNTEAALAFLAEFFTALDFVYLASLFLFFANFLSIWKYRIEKKARLVFVKRITNCLTS